MSSLIKLYPKFRQLGVPPEIAANIKTTSDNMGALIPGKFILRSGRDSDSEVEDIIQLNQLVEIVPALPIKINKYTTLVGVNPELCKSALVSYSSVVPPGEDISITIKALRNFSTEEFTDQYCFIIYLLD